MTSLSAKLRIELGAILLGWVFMALSIAKFRRAMRLARTLSEDSAALRRIADMAERDPK